MNLKYRLAAMTAAAAAIFVVLEAAPLPFDDAWAASTVDREPKVDETFGRQPVARHAKDPASRAVELAGKGHYAEAKNLADRSGDPVAIKLVEWLYLRDTGDKANYKRLAAFAGQNPDWPQTQAFTRAVERALLKRHHSPEDVLGYFDKHKPETAEGMLAMARAKLIMGDGDNAKTWAARGWRLAEADAATERVVLAEFGSLLTTADHKARLWTKVMAKETNAAIRIAKRLPADYQQAAKIAQLLARNHSGAKKSIGQLSAAMRAEPAMQYAVANFHRTADRNSEAAAVLLKMPLEHAKIYNPEEVWTERRLVARDLLSRKNKKSWPTAQKLAAGHGFSSGPNAVEGEFLAGWIALRYLNDPNTALAHFQRLEGIATTRTDKARGNYWLGRTHAVLGQGELAAAAFGKAAEHSTVYYGQLAKDTLGLGGRPITVSEINSSAAVRSHVAGDDLIRAFRLLARAGRQGEMGLFLWPIAKRFKTEEEMSAAASIIWDNGGPFMAVRLAKAAGSYGIDIDHWGYPIRAMPDWKPMGPKVEKALVYGLTRQESEFNAQAGSHAGAKGLMQLMPGTAKLISRQYKIKYNPKLLTADPSYNARLGAAHLGDLVKEFKGSYILSLVAYNAGPRRSLEWMHRYGDPRAKGVDPIDWVESIPFTETRYYVQKVLQNTHVYRSRLAPSSMRGMSADLLRGSGKKVDTAQFAQRTSHPPCGTSVASMAALIAVCD
jgi:peptidoglycan lytic transglycosylase